MKYIGNKIPSKIPPSKLIEENCEKNSIGWWINIIMKGIVNTNTTCQLHDMVCSECLFMKYYNKINHEDIPNELCLYKRKEHFEDFYIWLGKNYLSEGDIK